MGFINHLIGDSKGGTAHVLTVFEDFNRIKDQPEEVQHVVNNYSFNSAVCGLITLNVLSFGLEASVSQKNSVGNGERGEFVYVNLGFLILFLLEVCVRFDHIGWAYFNDFWNIFDYLIVNMGLLEASVSINGEDSRLLQVISLIRIARLLRVVRLIQNSLLFFRLWEVIVGFLSSVRMLIWVTVLLILVLHVSSIILTTLVAGDIITTEFWPESQIYFGSTWSSFKTLLQVVTYDQWMGLVMRPLFEVNLLAFGIVLMIMVVVSFGITSVMIAVLVESAIENAKLSNDRLKQSQEWDNILMVRLLDDFLSLVDASGGLGPDGFQALIHTESTSTAAKLLGITVDEASELFYLMDADGSGKISPDEYIAGLQKLKGLAKGQDVVSVISLAQLQAARAFLHIQRVRALSNKADRIFTRLSECGKGLADEQRRRIAESASVVNVRKQASMIAMMHKRLDEQARNIYPSIG